MTDLNGRVFRFRRRLVVLVPEHFPVIEGWVHFAILDPPSWPKALVQTWPTACLNEAEPVESNELELFALAESRLTKWVEIWNAHAADRTRRVLELTNERIAQEAIRAAEERRQALTDLVNTVLQPSSCDHFSLHVPPVATKEDIELAMKWLTGVCDVSDLKNWHIEGARELEARLGKARSWHFERLLSARIAERISARFLKQFGFSVIDVSLTQVTARDSFDWRRCDLSVMNKGEQLEFDVKNARRAWRNRGTYTRWTVPDFKLTRSSRDVRIIGTLSPYYTSSRQHLGLSDPLAEQQDPNVRILGMTSLSLLQKLEHEFLGTRLIRLASVNTASVLPPWVFSLPEVMYDPVKNARTKLERHLRNDVTSIEFLREDCRLPLAITLGAHPSTLGAPRLSRWEEELVTALRPVTAYPFGGLAALFLTLLTHFLRMLSLSDERTLGFSPVSYSRFLWPYGVQPPTENIDVGDWRSEARTPWAHHKLRYPMAIDDPLGIIGCLISALEILWTNARDQVSTYESFELAGWQILRGRSRIDGEVRTLLAYCGGRSSYGPCGAWPLLIGREQHCIKGFLVCPRCGHCCFAHRSFDVLVGPSRLPE